MIDDFSVSLHNKLSVLAQYILTLQRVPCKVNLRPPPLLRLHFPHICINARLLLVGSRDSRSLLRTSLLLASLVFRLATSFSLFLLRLTLLAHKHGLFRFQALL